MVTFRETPRQTPVQFHGGWVKTPEDLPRVNIGDHLLSSPTGASVKVDHYTGLPVIGMLLNDNLGDCTIAADGHIVEAFSFFGQGVEYVVQDSQALTAYEVVGGYKPGQPQTDNGALIPNALHYAMVTGFGSHKIAFYGHIPVTDMSGVKLSCAEFGYLSIGINLPNSAMDQFNEGKPWDVVANDGGIDGGHCVVVCGYDSQYLYIWTWGELWRMTYAFWNKYVTEAWPVVSREYVNAHTGKDPEGVSLYTLGTEVKAVLGFNPFPRPPAPKPKSKSFLRRVLCSIFRRT